MLRRVKLRLDSLESLVGARLGGALTLDVPYMNNELELLLAEFLDQHCDLFGLEGAVSRVTDQGKFKLLLVRMSPRVTGNGCARVEHQQGYDAPRCESATHRQPPNHQTDYCH